MRIAIFTTDDGMHVTLEVGADIAAAGSSADFRVTTRWISRQG
jgi:hypothetical protein